MVTKKRPIRIIIPEELRISQNERDHLKRAFQSRLLDVEEEGDLGPVIGTPINTTKLAVDVNIEVVGPTIRTAGKTAKKSAERSAKKSAKKGAKSRK